MRRQLGSAAAAAAAATLLTRRLCRWHCRHALGFSFPQQQRIISNSVHIHARIKKQERQTPKRGIREEQREDASEYDPRSTSRLFPPPLPADDFLSTSPSPSAPLISPFSHLPVIPALEDVLTMAITRANKHKIAQPPPGRSSPKKRPPRGSSPSSSTVPPYSFTPQQSWKIKHLCLLQLAAIKESLVDHSVTKCVAAFPPLSRLHPFDRAVTRLSLPSGETEYVKILRQMKRMMTQLSYIYQQAVNQMKPAVVRRQPPTAVLAASQLQAAAIPALLADSQAYSPDPSKSLVQSPVRSDTLSLLAHYKYALLAHAASYKDVYQRFVSLRAALVHLPAINKHDPDTLSVAVLGVPNCGKSSLIRMLSTGTPEVQNYSFTTRGIIVGHMTMIEEAEDAVDGTTAATASHPISHPLRRQLRTGIFSPFEDAEDAEDDAERKNRKLLQHYQSIAEQEARSQQKQRNKLHTQQQLLASLSPLRNIQIMDTPGLLFRPDVQRKSIELLTLTCLHYLPLHCVIYMLDPSQHCGYSLWEQLCVRQEVRQRYAQRIETGRVRWIDVCSKKDLEGQVFTVKDVWSAEHSGRVGEEETKEEKQTEESISKQRQLQRAEHLQKYGIGIPPISLVSLRGGSHSLSLPVSTLHITTNNADVRHPQTMREIRQKLEEELRIVIQRDTESSASDSSADPQFVAAAM